MYTLEKEGRFNCLENESILEAYIYTDSNIVKTNEGLICEQGQFEIKVSDKSFSISLFKEETISKQPFGRGHCNIEEEIMFERSCARIEGFLRELEKISSKNYRIEVIPEGKEMIIQRTCLDGNKEIYKQIVKFSSKQLEEFSYHKKNSGDFFTFKLNNSRALLFDKDGFSFMMSSEPNAVNKFSNFRFLNNPFRDLIIKK